MREPRDGVRKGTETEVVEVTIQKLSLKQATALTSHKDVRLTGNAGQWYSLSGPRKSVRDALSKAKVKGIIV